jgi:hypothetical protein
MIRAPLMPVWDCADCQALGTIDARPAAHSPNEKCRFVIIVAPRFSSLDASSSSIEPVADFAVNTLCSLERTVQFP